MKFCCFCLFSAIFLNSCEIPEPPELIIPDHIRQAGLNLETRLDCSSGPVSLYRVWLEGVEVLNFGALDAGGTICAELGPPAELLTAIFPDADFPRDLNVPLFVDIISDLRYPRWIQADELLEALIAGDVSGLGRDFGEIAIFSIDFSGGSWISTDLCDDHIYEGFESIPLIPGEEWRGLEVDKKSLRILYMTESGKLIDTTLSPGRSICYDIH